MLKANPANKSRKHLAEGVSCYRETAFVVSPKLLEGG